MIRLFLPVFLFVLAQCGDETVSRYGAAGESWVLREIDGEEFPARATLEFPVPGKIAGAGPCNRFSGEMTAPYPWFEVTNLRVTRAACPALAAEARFLEALQDMTLSETGPGTLLLSNDARREMVFTPGG